MERVVYRLRRRISHRLRLTRAWLRSPARIYGLPLLTVLVADGVVLAPWSPFLLRTGAALILVFALPGVGLLAFHRNGWARMPEWALWAVALSLATIPLVGLALAVSGIGVNRLAWLAAVNAIGLPGLVRMAVARDGPRLPRSWRGHGRRVFRLGWILLALTFATAALVIRVQSADTAARSHPFVELWSVPRTEAVDLGIRNAWPQRMEYRLEVSLRPGATRYVDLTLDPGGEWRRRVHLDRFQWESGTVVTARLFRTGESTVIREVSVRVQRPQR